MKSYLIALVLAFLFVGCTKSDLSYLNDAREHLKNTNVNEAIKSYEEMIAKFPKSDSCAAAHFELGKIYQAKLVKELSAEESYGKALDHYGIVVNRYPKSNEAPYALFMVGYIQANHTKRFDDATRTFNNFLSDYPNHELASAAQDELDYMGLSPEDILQKKLADGQDNIKLN